MERSRPVPEGFTFSNGTISGQSDTPEQSTFTVTVQDSGNQSPTAFQTINEGQTTSNSYTLTVTSGVSALDPAWIAVGEEGSAVQAQVDGDLQTLSGTVAYVERAISCVPGTVSTLLNSTPPSC